MEENSYYGSYQENNNINPLLKYLLILLVIIILFTITFLLVKGCSKESNEDILISAGKKYFSETNSAMPLYVGECNSISLDSLVNDNRIRNAQIFNNCDGEKTYVKVCKLDSENYQYTPFISCGKNGDTIFTDYKVGSVKDLIADKSDVRIKYLPEFLYNGVKEFYPNNKRNINEVQELYIEPPSSEYMYFEQEVKNAAKWYKETSGNSYWNNGGYSSVEPAGYPIKGKEGAAITKISLTVPSSESYRTIQETILYRSRSTSKPTIFRYICTSKTVKGELISIIPCKFNDNSFTEYKRIDYTCDGKNIVTKDATCSNGNWSGWTSTPCSKTDQLECESRKGYSYTDRTWQWYVAGTYRSYYPSGSATADGENTYYISAPESGYVKDLSTVTTAYKYYRLNSTGNSQSERDWVKLSSDYVELEEMLEIINKKDINVSSLKDINENEELRYSTQLEYANRK